MVGAGAPRGGSEAGAEPSKEQVKSGEQASRVVKSGRRVELPSQGAGASEATVRHVLGGGLDGVGVAEAPHSMTAQRQELLSRAAAFIERVKAQRPAATWGQQLRDGLRDAPPPEPSSDLGSETFPISFKTAVSCVPLLNHGTTMLIGEGLTRSMEEEFKQNEGGKWWDIYKYVVFERAEEHDGNDGREGGAKELVKGMVRDKGNGGKTLDSFYNLPEAREAELTKAEVAAIRLYSTQWFLTVNSALRRGITESVGKWATTISQLTSGLFKLSSKAQPMDLYRSVPGAQTVVEGARCQLEKGVGYTEQALLSCTADPRLALKHSGEGAAILFVISTTFSSRAANTKPFSLYPEQEEWTFPPFTCLELVDEVENFGNKQLVHIRPHVSYMRHFTDLLRFPSSSPNDPLTIEEYDELVEVAERFSSSSRATVSSKYASQAADLLTGSPQTAALGLEEYLGMSQSEVMQLMSKGVESIVEEFELHGTDIDKEWLRYIMHEPASEVHVEGIGVRDKDRNNERLSDFVAHKSAQDARLTEAHVLALRLYT